MLKADEYKASLAYIIIIIIIISIIRLFAMKSASTLLCLVFGPEVLEHNYYFSSEFAEFQNWGFL